MTIDQLMVTLESRDVSLFLKGDSLRYRAPNGALTDELKQQVANHREEIVAQLKGPAATEPKSVGKKCGRYDIPYWVDQPPIGGRIRTHCGKCGRFIGYRPENLA